MIEFTHILAPVDFSASSERSLTHAAALARWYRARLTVLHVGPTFDPLPVEGGLGFSSQVINPVTEEELVAEVRRLMAATGVPEDATAIASAGDASTTIGEEARRQGADLIVMGTHGRRGFKRLLLGSVTESVLRAAPCPVLTVPPRAPAESSQVVTFKRILCPVDFSPASLHALEFALDLARQADGRVTLVHSIEWLAEEEPLETSHFNVPEFRRQMEAEARQRLDALVAGESRTWCDIEHHVLFGRAYREILRLADTHRTELIVMGSQGRGGMGLALFGSTTQQVVRGAACPVLTVPQGPQS